MGAILPVLFPGFKVSLASVLMSQMPLIAGTTCNIYDQLSVVSSTSNALYLFGPLPVHACSLYWLFGQLVVVVCLMVMITLLLLLLLLLPLLLEKEEEEEEKDKVARVATLLSYALCCFAPLGCGLCLHDFRRQIETNRQRMSCDRKRGKVVTPALCSATFCLRDTKPI